MSLSIYPRLRMIVLAFVALSFITTIGFAGRIETYYLEDFQKRASACEVGQVRGEWLKFGNNQYYYYTARGGVIEGTYSIDEDGKYHFYQDLNTWGAATRDDENNLLVFYSDACRVTREFRECDHRDTFVANPCR